MTNRYFVFGAGFSGRRIARDAARRGVVLGGTTHWHKPVDLSLFNLELRPGKTYVLFIPDADAMDTPLPSQICITEEAHDAPGHKTVPIGYGRTPSPQATIIQCITQQNT